MIKINLLPVKRKKKPKPVPGFIVVAVLLLVIAVVAVVFLHVTTKGEIEDLTAQKISNDERLKDLNNRIKEIANYEQLVKSVEDKKKIIIQLRNNQSIPVLLLNEISRTLPNGLWIRGMSVKGNNVDISGSAFTNSDLVTYVNNLKSSHFFASVYLSESKRDRIKEQGIDEEVSVYNFKLRLTIKV
jgi:type IV pilus assembly protein PilN